MLVINVWQQTFISMMSSPGGAWGHSHGSRYLAAYHTDYFKTPNKWDGDRFVTHHRSNISYDISNILFDRICKRLWS